LGRGARQGRRRGRALEKAESRGRRIKFGAIDEKSRPQAAFDLAK
jgi:hypothetical protein